MTRRSPLLRALVAGGMAVLAIGAGCVFVALARPAPEPLPDAVPSAAGLAPEDARFSLFALGDTGKQSPLPTLADGQLAVARALTAHDAAAPVDALLFLGDHFYPSGLLSHELVPRIAANLVRPYCRFVALTGPRSAEVADACTLPQRLRRDAASAPTLYAVLGNHDHGRKESPPLQRDTLPEFVPNWRAGRGLVEVLEPVPGVSLVLVDTPLLYRGGEREVVEALRRSPGPWRILASHNPPATAEGKRPPKVLRTLREAGVPVQLALSGHEHNLQVITSAPPDPALVVVSGGGSEHEPDEASYEGRRMLRESTGFARVDLVGRGDDERLVVTLYATPRRPASVWWQSARLGAWSVTRDGVVEELR